MDLHTYSSPAVTYEGSEFGYASDCYPHLCPEGPSRGNVEKPLPVQLEMSTSLSHLLPHEPAIRVSIH